MTDNVAITPGTGATVSTDDDGTAQHQRVKLSLGADGVFTGTAAGETRDGGSGVAVWAVPRPKTAQVQTTIAGMSTSPAYVAAEQVGTILSFANAVPASGGTGIVQSALLLDKAAVVGAMDLYLFDRSVTVASDNATAAFSDADMAFCQGIINFPAPQGGTGNGFGQVHSLGIAIKPNATTLFGAFVSRSGFTAGSTTDLVATLTILQD